VAAAAERGQWLGRFVVVWFGFGFGMECWILLFARVGFRLYAPPTHGCRFPVPGTWFPPTFFAKLTRRAATRTYPM
jgi:hypothetical protein